MHIHSFRILSFLAVKISKASDARTGLKATGAGAGGGGNPKSGDLLEFSESSAIALPSFLSTSENGKIE